MKTNANREEILDEARHWIQKTSSVPEWQNARARFLGKKGVVTEGLRELGQLSLEERREKGRALHQLEKELEQLFEEARIQLEKRIENQQIQTTAVDVTLPGRGFFRGGIHPVSRSLQEIVSFFEKLGFAVAMGPEVEDDWHNFEALNIPPYHPARDLQDTFYLSGGLLLRTHTSPVQIRVMQSAKPPIRIVAPGRVYRRDSDVTHTPLFHQVEGLLVDEGIAFSHLKGVLSGFLRSFFGEKIRLRFRPSFFPFTEPSAEVDIGCLICQGKGCRVCKNGGWLEVLGCGMVHPNVFKAVGYNARKTQGFAFGMGVERLTMLRHGIDDLRLFFENDIRFIGQFQ
ncbi:MAG: phenylalanine--tRNA ligase subunit alpha [Deltaproteobacteria bacterium]|nr:phenylalanine--tRNA ligase subunit alpha [Deltaproteobacteria bacterium]